MKEELKRERIYALICRVLSSSNSFPFTFLYAQHISKWIAGPSGREVVRVGACAGGKVALFGRGRCVCVRGRRERDVTGTFRRFR